MKFRKYFKKNANGKIEFTPEELRALLDEVYENGKSDGYASGKADALFDVSFWEPQTVTTTLYGSLACSDAETAKSSHTKDLGDYIFGVNKAFTKAFPHVKSATQAVEDMSKQLESLADGSSAADVLNSTTIRENDISCTNTEANANTETPTDEHADSAEPKIYSKTYELPNGKLTIKSTNSDITSKELSKRIEEIFRI